MGGSLEQTKLDSCMQLVKLNEKQEERACAWFRSGSSDMASWSLMDERYMALMYLFVGLFPFPLVQPDEQFTPTNAPHFVPLQQRASLLIEGKAASSVIQGSRRVAGLGKSMLAELDQLVLNEVTPMP